MNITVTLESVPASPLGTRTASSETFRFRWLAFAHIPLWFLYGAHLWSRPHYQFVGLAVAAAYFFLYRALSAHKQASLDTGGSENTGRVSRPLFVPFLTIGVGCVVAAFLWRSYWMIAFGLIVQVFAVAYERFGWRCLRTCLPTFGLLLICLRPPFGYDVWILTTFQSLSTTLSASVLDRFEIPYLRNGNVIDIPEKSLFVAEACSGVNFFYATLCCVLLWSGFFKHWAFETIVLFLAAPIWILFGNVVRVVTIVLATQNTSVDLSEGWKHEALGIACFALCLFLTFNTRQILLILFPRIRRGRPAETTPTRPTELESANSHDDFVDPLELPASKRTAQILTGACLASAMLFLLVYSSDYIPSEWVSAERASNLTSRLEAIKENSLVGPVDGWTREGFQSEKRAVDSVFGQRSSMWRGQILGSESTFPAIASIDYPFYDWHDVSICYQGQGWNRLYISEVPDSPQTPFSGRRFGLGRRGSERAYVVFTHIDSQGDFIPAPKMSPALDFNDRILALFNRPLELLTKPKREPEKLHIQLQVLISGTNQPDEATHRRAMRLLAELARTAKSQLTNP